MLEVFPVSSMDLPFQTVFYILGVILSIKWLYDTIAPILAPRYGQKPWVGKYGHKKGNKNSIKTDDIKLQQSYDAIIVGGGAAGLAVGYSLKNQRIQNNANNNNNNNNFNFVIFEQNDDVATAWNYRYDRLHLHTCKELSRLPGLDYPTIYPRYISKNQFRSYLKAYSIMFDLPILFKHKILSAKYQKDMKLWTIKVEIISTDSDHNQIVDITTKVFINCCGREGLTEKQPHFKNEDKFKGSIMHSRYYKNGYDFTDKKVLIVGAGNSSIDIAMDLYEYGAAQPILQLIRSPIQMIRRQYNVFNVWIAAFIPEFIVSRIPRIVWEYITMLENKYNFSDLEKYGITFNYWNPSAVANLWERLIPPIMDFGWADMIRNGYIKVIKPEIKEFYDSGVILKNDDILKCDVVILATGFVNYENCHKYLDKELIDKCSDKFGMIRSGYHIDKYPGLYFCGFKDFKGRFDEISIEANRIAKDIFSKRK